jgi:hypothetical protein
LSDQEAANSSNSPQAGAKDSLQVAVESLGRAWAAWKSVKRLREERGESTNDPLSEAYYWTLDGLIQGVLAFILTIDEAAASEKLIAYEHTHKLFEPAVLRREILLAGQFLNAFEMLMGSVVGQLRASFYTDTTAPCERAREDAEYAAEVLSLDKGALRASCLWLQRRGVLTDEDIHTIDSIRRERNDIAHRLPALLFTKTWFVPVASFPKIATLVGKIDTWWIQQAGTNEPRSWSMVLLEYMIESVTSIDLGPSSPLKVKNTRPESAI